MFYLIDEPPVSGEDSFDPWDAGNRADKRTYSAMVHDFSECDDFELGGHPRMFASTPKMNVVYGVRMVIIEGWEFINHLS